VKEANESLAPIQKEIAEIRRQLDEMKVRSES